MSTQPQTATDDAAKARALGNELYRAGKLLQGKFTPIRVISQSANILSS